MAMWYILNLTSKTDFLNFYFLRGCNIGILAVNLFFRLRGPLAQSVEQLAFNQWVAGSIPARLKARIPFLGKSALNI